MFWKSVQVFLWFLSMISVVWYETVSRKQVESYGTVFSKLFYRWAGSRIAGIVVKITRNSDNTLVNLKIVQLVPCRLDRFDFFRNIASFNKRQRLTGECDDIGHFCIWAGGWTSSRLVVVLPHFSIPWKRMKKREKMR